MNSFWTALIQLAMPLALAAACTVPRAAEPPAPPSLSPSSDGTAVVDPGKKQVWSRCAEGMRWNGRTCTGEPLLMTHGEAVARAASLAKAEGLNWRLPHVTELRGLASKTARQSGRGPELFPAAPVGWYWSKTASLNTAQINQYDYANIARGRTNENAPRIDVRHRWAVNLSTGEARGDVNRSTELPVRLVRSLP